uniref:Uncharacterized protein n=1 Tax=Anopheles dirus TaxID=7168 RepID=A0A182NEN5_9DIPT
MIIALPKIAFGYPDFETSIIGLAELFFQTNRFVGVLLLVLYHDTLYTLVQDAESFTKTVLEESSAISQYLITKDAQISKITRLYLTALLVPANFYSYSPILSTLWKYYHTPGNDTISEFILPMEENFYGLDIRTTLDHYMIFGAIMVPTSFLCALVGTAKLVSILSLIKYCTIYFELVTFKLHEITRKQSFSTEMRSVLRMHQNAINCADLLKELTAPIMLLQLILCIMVWSSMLLYFTVSGFNTQFINLFVLFLFDTTETFGYCFLGNQLSDESARVALAVYECSWETLSPGIQKDLQLALLRSQSPVGITAGKFCFMTMQQFGEVVKTTYSFFIVLREQF